MNGTEVISRDGSQNRARDRVDWLLAAVVCAPIVSVTILSKLAIPPFGAKGIGISIPLILAAMTTGFLTGHLTFSPWRLIYYVLLIAFLGSLQIPHANAISGSSLLLLAALHLPYVFAVPRGNEIKQQIGPFFLALATFLALCAIAQFFGKFVVEARYLFPIENFIPRSFVVQQFNEQGVIEYGSKLYRSNGIFMLEPSFLSQLLGVACVFELCTLNRWHRLMLYGLAMVVTYAGTGFLVLAVCLPIFVIAKRRWNLLLIGILAIAVLAAAGDYLHLDRFVARMHEFNSPGSSGFARFVGGFYFLDQFLWADPWRSLFGFGAGSFKLYALRAHNPVAEMAITKMIFEYGIVGALAYFSFLFYCLSSSTLPRVAAVAVAMTCILSGIYIPFAHGLALSLLVWTSSPGLKLGKFSDSKKRQPATEATVTGTKNGRLMGAPAFAK